jgi:hypothetical protein
MEHQRISVDRKGEEGEDEEGKQAKSEERDMERRGTDSNSDKLLH